MSYVVKPAVGGTVGVGIPIVSEWVLKGARVSQLANIKASGLIGIGLGIPTLLGAVYAEWKKGKGERVLADEDEAMLGAFGATSTTTGVALTVLGKAEEKAGERYADKWRLRRGLEEEREFEEEIPTEEELVQTM